MKGFHETGAGAIGLNVKGDGQFVASITPSVEIGTTQQIDPRFYLRPYVSLGVALASASSWTIASQFEGAPSGISDFAVSTPMHDVSADVHAGAELLSLDNVVLKAEYSGRFASHYHDWSGSLKVGLRF